MLQKMKHSILEAIPLPRLAADDRLPEEARLFADRGDCTNRAGAT